jgi:hypothetical protein
MTSLVPTALIEQLEKIKSTRNRNAVLYEMKIKVFTNEYCRNV